MFLDFWAKVTSDIQTVLLVSSSPDVIVIKEHLSYSCWEITLASGCSMQTSIGLPWATPTGLLLHRHIGTCREHLHSSRPRTRRLCDGSLGRSVSRWEGAGWRAFRSVQAGAMDQVSGNDVKLCKIKGQVCSRYRAQILRRNSRKERKYFDVVRKSISKTWSI